MSSDGTSAGKDRFNPVIGELLYVMPAPAALPPLAGRRILIVEDEVILAFNMECEIEDAGGTVAGPAYSVSEAKLMLDGVDAAILDININGEPIWSVAEALGALGIPFVFASANCQDPNSVPAAYAGVPCFDKPVSMTRLIATLAEITG